MPQEKIIVVGAREHNLKNISVEIPRDKLVVISGISGSGKSSLAFDTIFAEGQRRYVESLSSYARQFLGQLDKPDVDSIEGLSPAISIDQRGVSHNPRSTVGTVTEIYDYLRLLFARAGQPHCPICGHKVHQQSAQEIVEALSEFPVDSRIMVLAPMVRGRKGTHQAVFNELVRSGFVRVRVNGEVRPLEEEIELDRYKNHNIEVVVDRLVIESGQGEDSAAFLSRLTDSVETALRWGEGTLIVSDLSQDPPLDTPFSEHLACPEHGTTIAEIEPRTFSFNTPHGACPECQGLGNKLEIDADRVIPDRTMSLAEGALAVMNWSNQSRDQSGYYWQMLEAVAQAYKIDLDLPVEELSEGKLALVLYGTAGKEISVQYQSRDGRSSTYKAPYEGVIGNLERRYQETSSDYIRSRIQEYMSEQPCPTCKGQRLRPEAMSVTINEVNIVQVTEWPVLRSLAWVRKLKGDKSPLDQRQRIIASRILKEVEDRLGFLVDVGLDYLTLQRSAGSLSGGEAQRIRLATQIGSRLIGVLYVLDEPSIGLHPRDNARLIRTLKKMRDLGNSVLVVEHDEATIRAADWLIDLGPGAGEQGGEIVAQGPVDLVSKNTKSVTGRYLAGKLKIAVPEHRRPGNGQHLRIIGARENNLKDISVDIPLGEFVCITGVSGSGKSTLMVEVLYKALARKLHGSRILPGEHDKLEGTELIERIINIDQSPIGRTPRSNPGTYTGLFDHIRSLFTELPESKVRGYKPGRFSFNVRGGRCEACEGQGQLRIEMQFLPDVYVPCEVCGGARFNRETLQVRFKGKTIADVLETSIDEAVGFFGAFPPMVRRLQTLVDVGLGYLKIGQPAPTLSGGEAQRVKLSRELSKHGNGHTLYILDEPSVGLHAADVHKLIGVLQRLVDQDNTVLIIEHHPDIIKVADWVIDLGPEGGEGGGQLVTEGTPEQIIKVSASHTGQFLKDHLPGA
ncbi:MAG: excinuclease ABC subunit UvrA [Anaerolineales bacterium]|nr:MAG: excinuclease ABC subunit UvrA [Anaerolineales bacterium]